VDVSARGALKQVLTRKAVADSYQIVTSALGLCSLAGTRMYTCMQHDDEAMKKTLGVWERLLSEIPKG